MPDCSACDDDREAYYDSEEGPVLGPCILCDRDGFMVWVEECELAGYMTDVVREDAAELVRESRDDFTLGLPF